MQTPTLAEQIAGQLRRSILTGDLKPGEAVKERDNAAELGVSRTPMREAIRRLANEGLIVLRPSRSPIVANPTRLEVTDNLNVLRVLEGLSGELACENATPAELHGVRDLHEKMVEMSNTADPLDFFETDMQFHAAITAASHNLTLVETQHGYTARLWRIRYLSARQRSDRRRVLQQHGLIVKGLEARDSHLVAREISSHIRHIDVNIAGLFSSDMTKDTKG